MESQLHVEFYLIVRFTEGYFPYVIFHFSFAIQCFVASCLCSFRVIAWIVLHLEAKSDPRTNTK